MGMRVCKGGPSSLGIKVVRLIQLFIRALISGSERLDDDDTT